jgi:hypothetical protein
MAQHGSRAADLAVLLFWQRLISHRDLVVRGIPNRHLGGAKIIEQLAIYSVNKLLS